jgi:hypothetical protein
MKKIVLVSVCVLALASVSGAYAQTNQPAPGASGQGEVGPSSSGKMKTTTGRSNMKNQAGDSMGRQPGRAGGSNTNNMGSQAGGGAGSGGK